ncbi:MAG: hypothetical protein HOO86_11550 [Bacteroidales bacterium]|nr:hypothetical protein [Bacteroidales bacterium]
MTTLNFLLTTPPNWFVYSSGFASIIALLFVILYFIKPCLKITDESDYSKKKIRIKCVNNNFLRSTMKDIQCDIVVSEANSFYITDTLELQKDWITGICYHDNYIFKVKNIPDNFDNKHYLKVRILAINILGIKKFYQRVFKID